MLHLFGLSKKTNDSVNTEIFYGNSYSGTFLGGIGLDAEKDAAKAKITITDEKRQKSEGKLQIFHLSQLKNLPEYQSAQILKYAKLIHTWEIRRNENSIYIAAGNAQHAIIFTSLDVENDFRKLSAFAMNLTMMDYFEELVSCAYFKEKFHLSIDQLQEIPGMNENRIQLLNNNIRSLEQLISFGMTLDQIAQMDITRLEFLLNNASSLAQLNSLGWTLDQIIQMDKIRLQLFIDHVSSLRELLVLGITPAEMARVEYKRLENVLKNKYDLNKASHFVTIRQILNLDSKPLNITSVKKSRFDSYVFLESFNGSWRDYEVSSTRNTVTITHKKKTGMFKVESYTLTEDAKEIFKEKLKNCSLIKLIHNWYIFKSNDEIIIYSPELNNITHETHQLDVPQPYINLQLLGVKFYDEKRFADFLKEKNRPIEIFRELPGMTEKKLLLLSEKNDAMERLIELGVKIEEFASIDDLRLENLLVNYNELSNALKFVPISAILALPTTPALEEKPSRRMHR